MGRLEYVLVFFLGFVSCAVLFFGFVYDGSVTGAVVSNFSLEAPSDLVDEERIVVFDDMLVLRVANVSVSRYEGSGSMSPVFDEGANGIRVVPGGEDDISVGDIVSYRKDGVLVVHRVVEKGIDDGGVYFVVKGDNNFEVDGKVRFGEIEFLTIGVIW